MADLLVWSSTLDREATQTELVAMERKRVDTYDTRYGITPEERARLETKLEVELNRTLRNHQTELSCLR